MRKYFKFKYVKDRVIMLTAILPIYVLIMVWGYSEHIPMIRLILASLVAIPMIGWLVITLIHSDKCIKNVIQYCDDSGYTMQDLEEDFATADVLGHRIRCGCHWIYYLNENGEPDIVEINEIASIEFRTESDFSGGSQDYIYCHLKNQKIRKIPSFKSHYKELLKKLEKFGSVTLQG